ncbi:hypothetical protein SAMN02745753_02584 [Marinomonas polaris DSM 16579]|uniref:Uncharacterized protein n=1 Tax=Marinomonas polaris DSM 16579 TaxID=1122206 RepID=A0A1M5EAQ5_9GAMM|nr:hypothetical protein [Marinomonas polaris]SHF76308.1 hypothetical protein SAMN02745753_02584 [Marinomonas polaris DSM 16579]
MFKQFALLSIIAGASIMMASNPIFAADQDKTQDKDQIQREDMEMVYGSQLMTQQERLQYHQQYFALKTEQEREKFRDLHHDQMLIRAREQGVTLPSWSSDMGMNGGGMGSNRNGVGSNGGKGNGGSGSPSN